MKFAANAISKATRIGFAVVGLIFLVAAIFILKAPKVDYIETQGIIDEIEESYNSIEERTDYSVYVSYQAAALDGIHSYQHVPYGSYSSSMKVGDAVTVLYNPDAPDEIQAPGFEKVPYVVGAAGIAAMIFGLWPLFGYLFVRLREKRA